MKNEFQNWIAEIKTDENSFLDYDDELTLSWLELICNRDIEAIDNKVCNDLNAVFDKSYTAEVRRILPEIEKVVRSHHNKKKRILFHISVN